MEKQPESSELENQTTDYITIAVKGALGAIPFAGSLLAELVGTVIPNQRIERIARFASVLEERISKLEQEYVRAQLNNENFSDLFEEGVRQASRSLTDERREYIANLITNSLNPLDIEYIESKQLLRILGEINDIEVIWLRFYLDTSYEGDKEFRDRHSEVLQQINATFSDPPIVLDKESLQNSYSDHLYRLGLLDLKYEIDIKTHLPKFDNFSGKQKSRGYEITHLGRLLLHHIGITDSTY